MSSQGRREPIDPRVAAAGLRASGVIGGVGLGFLVAMYAAFGVGARSAGMTLGWVNDVTGVVTLPLALPGMVSLHARIRPQSGVAADALLAIGIGSSGAIVVLQALLVSGALTFEQQIGPVSLAYLALAAWLIGTGRIAARSGLVRGGTRLGVLAALYVGYPLWAFRVARAIEATPAPLTATTTA